MLYVRFVVRSLNFVSFASASAAAASPPLSSFYVPSYIFFTHTLGINHTIYIRIEAHERAGVKQASKQNIHTIIIYTQTSCQSKLSGKERERERARAMSSEKAMREEKKKHQQYTYTVVVDFGWLVCSSDDVSSFQYQSFFRFCRVLNEFLYVVFRLNANNKFSSSSSLFLNHRTNCEKNARQKPIKRT